MEELQARIAYLHGLANGLERVDGQQTAELMRGILDVLDGIAGELEALREDTSELDEYVQSVDEDLAQVENEFWSTPGGESQAGEEAATSVECPNCGLVLEFQPSDFADEEGRVELICPNCGENIRLEREERQGGARRGAGEAAHEAGGQPGGRDGRDGPVGGGRGGGRARMRAGGQRERASRVAVVEDQRG